MSRFPRINSMRWVFFTLCSFTALPILFYMKKTLAVRDVYSTFSKLVCVPTIDLLTPYMPSITFEKIFSILEWRLRPAWLRRPPGSGLPRVCRHQESNRKVLKTAVKYLVTLHKLLLVGDIGCSQIDWLSYGWNDWRGRHPCYPIASSDYLITNLLEHYEAEVDEFLLLADPSFKVFDETLFASELVKPWKLFGNFSLIPLIE